TGIPPISTRGMTGRLSCGGMGIRFLTAWRRWSIRSMHMSSGEAAPGSSTRRPLWTLIGSPMAITFDSLAPLVNHIRVTLSLRSGVDLIFAGPESFCQEQLLRPGLRQLQRSSEVAGSSQWIVQLRLEFAQH